MVYRPVGEFSDRPPRVLCAELRDGKHQPTHVLADNHCALAIDTTHLTVAHNLMKCLIHAVAAAAPSVIQ
jgi:hypothetical protein